LSEVLKLSLKTRHIRWKESLADADHPLWC
jgi:hypothetical protein